MNPGENGSPVWVTPPPAGGSREPVAVCVDFDGDNSGTETDAPGYRYDRLLSLEPLSSTSVYDPDGDQTGMILYVCKMMNNTDFEHPMHLHGHCFRVLAINDIPTRLREWRDTVVIDPRGSCDIAFVADNPGEWMFHCHVLDHAAGGMMGTVAVEA